MCKNRDIYIYICFFGYIVGPDYLGYVLVIAGHGIDSSSGYTGVHGKKIDTSHFFESQAGGVY